MNFPLKQKTKSISVPLSRGGQVAEISEENISEQKNKTWHFLTHTQKKAFACVLCYLCEVTFKLFVSSEMSSYIISLCRFWCDASLEPCGCLHWVKCCICIGWHHMYHTNSPVNVRSSTKIWNEVVQVLMMFGLKKMHEKKKQWASIWMC